METFEKLVRLMYRGLWVSVGLMFLGWSFMLVVLKFFPQISPSSLIIQIPLYGGVLFGGAVLVATFLGMFAYLVKNWRDLL